MQTEERRAAVLAAIKDEKSPISASTLAGRFSVSRQIIVGDIAILRAEGADINATPRGYVMGGKERGGIIRRIACQHDHSGMEEELNTIVDMGCTVVDVIVEHPIYGEIIGALQLAQIADDAHDLDISLQLKRGQGGDVIGFRAGIGI